MTTRSKSFFTELRAQIALFCPVLFTQIAQTSFSFVDTVMTGRVGAVDMAAVALSASLWMPILLFGQGVILAVTPAVAQLRGHAATSEANSCQQVSLNEANRVIRQGLWLALFVSIPLMAIVYALSFRLQSMGVTPDMAGIAGRYLRAMVWGGPGYLLFVALRCSMEGFARVRPAMVAGFVGMFVNIPFNALFIFGLLGAPRMGGVGAGVATAITNWAMFAVLVVYAARMPDFRAALRFGAWEGPIWSLLRRLGTVGLPGALAMLFEVSMFAAVAILLAPLGAIQVAGHQVALNVSSVIFMLPLSIGIAATIRVSYGLGQQSPDAVRLSTRVALAFALTLGMASALFTMLLRHPIALMYNNDPAVTTLAASLLVMAGTYQVTDALQVASVGILRGYNDTKSISFTTFVVYWLLALPLGYSLARTNFWGDPLGPMGFWIAFVVGVSLTAVVFLLRLRVLERRLYAGTLRMPGMN